MRDRRAPTSRAEAIQDERDGRLVPQARTCWTSRSKRPASPRTPCAERMSKAHSGAWTTALAVLCSTPGWDFFDLGRTAMLNRLKDVAGLVGPGSPMKHGRYADFSKQTFLPGKTIAR
jgi:hypothetical protein